MLFCWLAVCSEDQTFKGALSPGLIPKIKAIWTLQWTEAYFSSCENIRRLKPDQSLGINFTRFCLSHYLSVLPALILLSSILPYPNISNSLWRSLVLLGFSGYHNFFMNCFPQNQSPRLTNSIKGIVLERWTFRISQKVAEQCFLCSVPPFR